MKKCLIFDVDGTIIDTEKAMLKSLQQTLKEEGLQYDLEDLRFVLGIPGKEALRRLNIKDMENFHRKWQNAVLGFGHEVSVFEGLEQVFQTLRSNSVRTGIVTSKTKQELVDEFEPFGLNAYFEHIISASDTKKHKPHPEPLIACLERLKISSDEGIYIGDSVYDMQCSQAAGVEFALALWGAKSEKGFESADYVLKDPKEIINLMEH